MNKTCSGRLAFAGWASRFLAALLYVTPSGLAAQAAGADTAVVFAPGVISDERWQYRLAFTPDGDTAYYTVADGFFPRTRRSTIMTSARQANGEWGTPAVAPFSGTWTDIDPFITHDGRRLYFSSIRPIAGKEVPQLDLFYVERTAAGWGEPVRLGPEVNTGLDELYASLDDQGNLYFASGPFGPTPDAAWDIYMAPAVAGGFGERQRLDAISTRGEWNEADPTHDWEFNPEISPDGQTLLFTSLRPGGHGFGDIYVSRRGPRGWGQPVNLGPVVNTAADEFHPTLSRDGRYLYFARTVLEPEPVPSSFHVVSTCAMPALRHLVGAGECPSP